MNFKLRKLSQEERSVIEGKGTEKPFSGKYLSNFEKGVYSCRRCGLGLYRSEDKFKSGCGWPAFEDELYGAVSRQADPDGLRTEILCSRCGAHLGHIFKGEQLSPKNVRHCVNSISLDFIPAEKLGVAYFAGGCFWGVEYYFINEEGVLHVMPGYMGGGKENPTYKDVCSGKTGHAEVVMILFDKSITDFRRLAKLFFEIHDPTQLNKQGPDIGTQYRSEIFFSDDEQKNIAEELKAILISRGIKVVTKITKAADFYQAEEYHRRYYIKTGKEPYCHLRVKRFE